MRMYSGTRFLQICKCYAWYRGVKPKTVVFQYNGEKLDLIRAPNELGMDNKDVIDFIRYTKP